MSCSKVGSGTFAGNSSCQLEKNQRRFEENLPNDSNLIYQDGIPYAETELTFRNKMPLNIIGALGAVSGGLNSIKTRQAEAGKEFSKPKTAAGKLLGKLSGRTAGYETMQSVKSSSPINSGVEKNLRNQGFPIGGNVSFGSGTNQTALPFPVLALVGGVIVAFFYFVTNKGKSKRRR